MTRKRVLAGVGIAALLAVGVIASTRASWVSQDTSPLSVTYGSLDLHSTHESGSWWDASVPNAPVAIDPATFLVTAGDVLRMSEDFSLVAVGDNLAHEITVDWAEPPALGPGVTATFSLVEDPDGAATVLAADVPLGSAVSSAASAAAERSFRLSIDLHVSDTRADRTFAQAGITDIGTVRVAADQVRGEAIG